MERLIDHKPTKQELVAMFGCVPVTLNGPFFDQDGEYASIARLHMQRGNQAKYKEYMGRIKDRKYAFNMQQHCTPPTTDTD